MKIRTKTSLIILFAAILLALFFIVANVVFELFHQQKYVDIIYQFTTNFTQWNNKYSSESIEPFAKYYMESQVEKLLNAVEKAYIGSEKNCHTLTDNENLKKLFIDSTYTKEGIHGGYAALIYDKKKILICSNNEDTGMDIENLLERYSEQIKKKFPYLSSKDSLNYYFSCIDNDRKIYNEFIYVYFIPETKLMLFYSLSINDYFSSLFPNIAKESEQEKEKANRDFDLAFNTEIEFEILFTIISFILVYLLSIPLIVRFSKSVSSPVSELRNKVLKLGNGSFNVSIQESGIDEIQDLINSFNFLGKELSNYMEDLEKEVRQREKIETEINIARKIQESMLPKITSDFVSRKFQLGAKLLPAEKVAGDFYDFFFVNGKLVLCIADVSGKGISAAFFMVMVKTLIRNLCFQYSSPEKVLIEATKTLSEENQSCMFATVFLCFFDFKTGSLKFSNAGHESILLIRKDKSIHELGRHEIPPIGVFPDSIYKTETIEINNEDILIFYTDGITEARLPDNTFFGIENFKKLLIENNSLSSQELCNLVIDRVNSLEGNKLYDDITIMIFKKLK